MNITKLENNWVDFEYGQYAGQAKIFDEGSSYGIAGGRISKLTVHTKTGDCVFNYDRGYDYSELSTESLLTICAKLCDAVKP